MTETRASSRAQIVTSDRSPRANLVKDLRRGDRTAMAVLFEDHFEVLYNYCYRRTGSWSSAEDLASTVYLQAWRSRRRAVEVDGSPLPWLYGIAANVVRNHQRWQRRHRRALARTELIEPEGVALADTVTDQVDSERRLVAILDRLTELPSGDQDVFTLVAWEGLSYAEAAAALKIPIGTVRSRLSRVRRRLRHTDSANRADQAESEGMDP